MKLNDYLDDNKEIYVFDQSKQEEEDQFKGSVSQIQDQLSRDLRVLRLDKFSDFTKD